MFTKDDDTSLDEVLSNAIQSKNLDKWSQFEELLLYLDTGIMLPEFKNDLEHTLFLKCQNFRKT